MGRVFDVRAKLKAKNIWDHIAKVTFARFPGDKRRFIRESDYHFVQFPVELARIEDPDLIPVPGDKFLYYNKKVDALQDYDPERQPPRFAQVSRYPQNLADAAMRIRSRHRKRTATGDNEDRARFLRCLVPRFDGLDFG